MILQKKIHKIILIKDGEIYTKQGLDRERRSQYVFTVKLEEKRPSTKIVSKFIVFLIYRNSLFL